jgi:hypothetical protein
MKPRGLRKWEKARAYGMARFVLFRGVLSYGLTMFVVMTFIVHRGDLIPRFIAISAVLWLVGGAVFGALTWFFMERIYRKFASGISL